MTKSKHVERIYVDNGKKTVVDSRTVKVTVNDTKDLKSLQNIQVNWSGARQTGGLVADENSDFAQNEEYSFDLFECRGLDSTTVPVKDRVSPETCWTQYADERFQYGYTPEPAWQSDLYATPGERRNIVDSPPKKALATTCTNGLYGTLTQRWVPFDAEDGHVYAGGLEGCQGQPPEATPANVSNLTQPSNETFGQTSANGTGSAKFDIFTAEDHASLGCSPTVPCSLVAIPIEGISCDPEGSTLPADKRPSARKAAEAKANCETNGNFAPGSQLTTGFGSGAAAVDGSLWWSPSNWRNRISFPLSFAVPDNVCSVVNNQTPVAVYGSELANQAFTAWAPHFCLNPKLFSLSLVQTSEPEARTQLNTPDSRVYAAIGSQPPDPAYTEPTVQAPSLVSGFGIAFNIDNAQNEPVVHLNLDARLVAKLLTMSYPAEPNVQSGYPLTNGVATLSKNPLNIAFDPEFDALNPGIAGRVGLTDVNAAATLLELDQNSDAVYALTSWINADPAARAWLNGKPDPWGMRVNPNYQGIKLPVSRWPLLDTYTIPNDTSNPCLYLDPVPFLPLVADPQSSLLQIAIDTDFGLSQSQTTCSQPNGQISTVGDKLVADGRQSPGYRFMLSLVSLADAKRLDLNLASLESTSTVSPSTQFTSSKGMTFVAPTNSSLKAAADAARPDESTGTWEFNYNSLRSPKNSNAYPGTMILSTSIPTKGLSTSQAADYATYLRFLAGPGQNAGDAEGDLPPGYLPMTAKNGLGHLVDYTLQAARAVQSQDGEVPAVVATKTSTPTTPPSTSNPTTPPTSSSAPPSTTSPVQTTGPSETTGTTQTGPVVTTPAPPVTGATSTSSGAPGHSPVVASGSPVQSSAVAALGQTGDVTGGAGADILPVLLGALLVTGAAAAVTKFLMGNKSK